MAEDEAGPTAVSKQGQTAAVECTDREKICPVIRTGVEQRVHHINLIGNAVLKPPLPTICMFIGSSHVCDGVAASATAAKNCDIANLNEIGSAAPYGWQQANVQVPNNYDYINYGVNLTDKGTSPFSNSGHPSGCNMVFCDGHTAFISATINGDVYAKLITPAGCRVAVTAPRGGFRQAPLSQDAFAP